jgi:prepilin-type N-terminal cleavage/methylation domain-containing protein/prepilin-type processing-associated H-X9-DG protein
MRWVRGARKNLLKYFRKHQHAAMLTCRGTARILGNIDVPAKPLLQLQRGFTLIELLVVVAIIAILAGLLLSAIKQVKDAANQMKCGRQMQQVILAWTAYRGENQGVSLEVYPSDPSWNTWSSWTYRPWERRWQHVLEEDYLNTFAVFNCPVAKQIYPNAAVLDAPVGGFPRGASMANGIPSGWCTCLMAYNSQCWGRAVSWNFNIGSAPFDFWVLGPMTDRKVDTYLSKLPGAKRDRCPVFFDGKWQNDGSNQQNDGNGVWWPHRGKRSPMGFSDGHVEVVSYTDVVSWNPLQVR